MRREEKSKTYFYFYIGYFPITYQFMFRISKPVTITSLSSSSNRLKLVMGERNWKDWRPFVYGGLASIVAELCK